MQQQIQSAFQSEAARSAASPDGVVDGLTMNSPMEAQVIFLHNAEEPLTPGEERQFGVAFLGQGPESATVDITADGEVVRSLDLYIESGQSYAWPDEPEGPVENAYYVTVTIPEEPFDICAMDTCETFSPEDQTPMYGDTSLATAVTSTPATVGAGERFDVETAVYCGGDNQSGCRDQTVSLLVDGTEVATGTASNLDADTYTSLSFNLQIDEPGEHTITFEGAGDSISRAITVEGVTQDIVLGDVTASGPDTVGPEDSVTVSASINNHAAASRGVEVIWRVAGVELSRTTHTIPASSSQTVTNTFTHSDLYDTVGRGFYSVEATIVAGDGYGAQGGDTNGFIVGSPGSGGGDGGDDSPVPPAIPPLPDLSSPYAIAGVGAGALLLFALLI